jgi:hypothetical protein
VLRITEMARTLIGKCEPRILKLKNKRAQTWERAPPLLEVEPQNPQHLKNINKYKLNYKLTLWTLMILIDVIDTRVADDYDGILTKPVMVIQIYTTWDIAWMK